MYESFAESDIEAVVATWAPDIELVESEGAVVGGIYHGLDEVIGVFRAVADTLEEASVVPERYIDGGDTVVALGTASGTSTETGTSIEFPFAHVFDFDDGKISRWISYFDTALFNATLEG